MKGDGINRTSSTLEDLGNLRDSLNDKGWRYFQRPIALGLVLSLAFYQLVYRAPMSRLRSVEAELEATRATAKYASNYKDLNERLAILYSILPKTKDPEGWLLGSIRESLRLEDIVPTSISQPKSTRTEGYRFLSITVQCDATYKQLASWIARLEGGDTLLFIERYRLSKKRTPIGTNTAEVVITTAMPEGALAGEPGKGS